MTDQAATTDTGASQTAATQAPTSWVEGFTDPDLKGWVENKGFHKATPEALAKSYRSLEQYTGKRAENMLELPTTDDQAAWDSVYNRLGRPESPDKYDIPMPEGQSSTVIADWARKAFHANGLTGKQAKEVIQSWNQLNQDYAAQAAKEAELNFNNQKTELEKEWGAAKEKNYLVVKGTAAKFGLNDDMVSKLSDAIGYKQTMQILHSIGSGLGEAQFVEGQGGEFGGAMSPSQAKAKEQELLLDMNFRKAYMKGDPTAVARVNDLRKMQVQK